MSALVHDQIGRGNFLALYFAGGATGSIFSLVGFVLGRNYVTASLGASAAVCAIVAGLCVVKSEWVPRASVSESFVHGLSGAGLT